MASRSLGEAILRALAGAGQELGGQMQENQKFNLQRGDAFQRLKEEREWRRQGAERDQANADRTYGRLVSNQEYTESRDKAKDAGDYRKGINNNISDFLKGIEEQGRYATQQGWLQKQFELSQQRLEQSKSQSEIDPFNDWVAKEQLKGQMKDEEGNYVPLTDAKINAARVTRNPRTMYNRSTNQWSPGFNPANPYGKPLNQASNPQTEERLLGQFSNPRQSAVGELNQPDQNGLQRAFQQQLPPDFNSWSPEDQQAAWEMFMEMQGQ